MLGNFDDARSLLGGMFERFAELGMSHGGATSHSWFVETLARDHAAAEREARRGLEQVEQAGDVGASSTFVCLLARSLYHLGRDQEASATLAIGEELSASDDTLNQILLPQVRATLLARKGESDSAEMLAREAVTIADQTDWLQVRGDALLDLAAVLALSGRHVEAAIELERALHLYEQKGNLVSADQTRALVADLHRAVV